MRIFLLIGVMAIASCGGEKKDDSGDKAGPADTPAAKPADKPAAKPADGPASVSIEKLGLKATLPAGAKVGDGPVGDGVMIQGPNLVVTIEQASAAQTLEEAKGDADMYTPQNLKEEALADGWMLVFENTGGMGTNYWVQSQRTIGGKTYACGTTASNAEQQANAAAVCKSLTQ